MTKLPCLAFGFALLLAACATTPADVTGDDATAPDAGVPAPPSAACQEATQHSDLAWIQPHVFTTSCAFGGCHNGTASNAGHLVLLPGVAQRNLVGMPAETASPWTRVVAGEPSQSYLLVAIGQADGPEPKGGLMPLSQPALCVEKREAIERWIAAGAQP